MVNGHKKKLYLTNQLDQVLILFWQEILRRKYSHLLKRPFHNTEVIMDIEFSLISSFFSKYQVDTWAPFYLLSINIKAIKMRSIELDLLEH